MKARPYQLRAEREALAIQKAGGGGFLLCLEMRTGKTLVSLSIAKKCRKAILIVCPKVALPVWQKAVKTLEVARSCNGIYIVHYEALTKNSKSWYRWADKRIGQFVMILDEAHFIKDRGSERSRVCRTVSRRAAFRLALTGTPIAQGIQDAWAIYDYLGRIFGPWDDTWEGGLDGKLIPGFESTYLQYGGFRNHEIVAYRNEDQFNKIFHKYSFRITLREAKEEGGKEKMILKYSKQYFDLHVGVREVYDELQEELEATVNEKKVRVDNVLSCVTKLQQIAGGFYIEKSFTGKYTKKGKPVYKKIVHELPIQDKLDLLRKEVEKVEGKFIVICRFIHELEAVQTLLEGEGYSCALVRGGNPYDGEFKTDSIAMQIQSGMAVDMSLADTVIFYSTDYSYINFEQSRFRILSYEKSFGKYVFLLARGTVDEVIYFAVKFKKKVADLIIDKYRVRKRKRKHGIRQLDKTDRKPEGKTEGKTRRRWRGSFRVNLSKT